VAVNPLQPVCTSFHHYIGLVGSHVISGHWTNDV